MLQGEVGLPAIGSYQTLCRLISRRGPHITIRIKEELVHTGFVWKKWLGLVTSTNELELTDFSVTSSTEDSRLIFVRLGVNVKIQDTAEVALECLGALAAGNVENKHFGIRAPGDQHILALESRTNHRLDKVTVSLVLLPRLSGGHVPAPDGLIPTAGKQQLPVRAET
jgi:hypothetical protein